MGNIEHNKSHAIDSSTDHTSAITEDNVVSADANGLPKDSSITVADLTTLTTGGNGNGMHTHGCTTKLTKGGEEGIPSGAVVYYSGQSGNDPVIKLARADSATTMPAAGITLEGGGIDDDIMVRTFGLLNSTDTQGLGVGNGLYVSTTSFGEWTAVKPTGATSLIQKIASVLDVGASGNIEVSGANRVNDIPNIAQNNVWNGDSDGVPQATATPTVTDLTFTDPQGDPFTISDLSAHQLDAFNEMATTEFDTTCATTGGVRTITITQPESEELEFIISEKKIVQPTQVPLTKVHTGLNGTDPSPNAIYTYVQNDGADEPELTASNVNPNGAVNHVDGVYELVGSIAGSVSNVYATNNVKPYLHEKLENILDRFKEQGSLYKSGMAITADADSFAIATGTATHVLADATIPALEVDRVTPVDDQFTIEDDSTYTTYDDFQIDEYFDGVAVTNGHHVKCRIGAVINNPELTSARFHIIPQNGSATYATAAQAWADVSGMAQTTPRADIVKYAFVDIADIVIKNTTGTFTLIAHPDTGLYYSDVRGATGAAGGGGGAASQNIYESFTGDSGSTTAPSSTGTMAVVGGTGITTTVTTDQTSVAGDAASKTAVGVVELATTAEIDTGTDSTRAIPVDQLEASKYAGGLKGQVTVTFDGGGSALTTGAKAVYTEIPYAGTITSAQLVADQSGSIVIDVWNDTYAEFPPTVADTITASAKPTLSGTIKSTDSTLTGWTKTITAGDILEFNIDSVATVTKVILTLGIDKTGA